MDDPEIGGLIKTLLSNPDSVTEDEVNKLAKHPLLNKYSIINNNAEKTSDTGDVIKKQAYFSYSNLQEDYMNRFNMTSLVGFLYRMYKEYEVDPKNRTFRDERRVDPKGLDKTTTSTYDIPKIEGMIKKLNNMVTEIKVVNEMIEKIKYKFINLELDDKEPTEDDKAALEDVKKSQSAIMFAITQTLVEYGQDAGRRIHTVLDECRKHKDIVEEINKAGFSLPPDPEDVVIPEPVSKNIIKDFLDKYFEYDPDQHVRSVLNGEIESIQTPFDTTDTTRPSLNLLKAKIEANDLKEVFTSRESYNASMFMLNNPELLKKLSVDPEVTKARLLPVREACELLEHIPPTDTFHRWNYYKEVNMEEIRSVVNAIYNEKPELEFMINVYDVAEGTSSELESHRKQFAAKYNEELSSDLHVATVGMWTVLADYKKNRENIDFYNRHTEVLKRIMDQHEQDKKLGKDLMNKRVKKAKSKNIEEMGKDAEILAEYKKQVTDLTTLGAVRVLNAEEKKAIEDAKKSIRDIEETMSKTDKEDIELLNSYKKQISELSEIGTNRALTSEEKRSLEDAQKAIKDIKEVGSVPDNAIQVNIFTHDTQKGDFVKGAFYTEAEKPPTQEQIQETLKQNKVDQKPLPDNLTTS